MTTQEAFKFGFLLRCAEEGLSSSAVARRVKLAFDASTAAALPGAAVGAVKDVGGAAAGLGKGTLDAFWRTWLGTALAGGAVGAGGGYLMANAMDDNVDPADARDAETLAEYQRAIQELSRRRQLGVA